MTISNDINDYEKRTTDGGDVVYFYKDDPLVLACPKCDETDGEIHHLFVSGEDGWIGTCRKCKAQYKLKPKPPVTHARMGDGGGGRRQL